MSFWRIVGLVARGFGLIGLWLGLAYVAADLGGLSEALKSWGFLVPYAVPLLIAFSGILLLRVLWLDFFPPALPWLQKNFPSVFPSLGRISIVEFGRIARRRGWAMTGPGMEALDLVDGLRQAAVDGELHFDGRFGAQNPDIKNYYPLRHIDPEVFVKHAIDAPLYFEEVDNFGTGFTVLSGDNPGVRDLHLSDRAAALRWLEIKGPHWRGQAQKKHDEQEIRRLEFDKLVAQQLADQSKPDA